MDNASDKTSERPSVEPEIIPPDRTRRRPFSQNGSGGIFYDLRGEQGSFVRITKISGFKLALWLTLIVAIALALVLTFASLFVVAAVVSTCLVAVAGIVGWVKAKLR
jgi:hypothetical protein